MRLDLPLRRGFPQWAGILTSFIVILPVSMMNGAYTGSALEISNTLGAMSEDVMMAYYCASAGMAIAYPVVPKVIDHTSPRTLLLVDLFLQVLLSLVCAKTEHISVVTGASFMLGFLKAFVMLWFIRAIKPWFTPKDVRSEFYAYFYPLVFSGGQLSMMFTAMLSYYYDWKYMYYLMMMLLLLAMLAVLVVFRHTPAKGSIPVGEIDFKNMTVASVGILVMMFFFNYGKPLDWFHSPVITACCIIAPLLLCVFLWQMTDPPKQKFYISTAILKHWKSPIGYVFMFFVMFMTSSSTLNTRFLINVLGVDSLHAYSLNVWQLPGYIFGAFICFWWFRWQRWRFRYLISAGMFCYFIYFAILYFGVTPSARYEMFIMPMVLRGFGMMVLFIAFGLYVVEDLEPKLMLSNTFFLINSRSVLAPIIAISFFSNVQYGLQQQYVQSLSETVTEADPIAAGRYSQALKSAISQGHGFDQAQQMAVSSLDSTLQIQGMLLSIKDIMGTMMIAALVVAIVSAFIPFHKAIRVRVVRTGEDMV